MKPTWRNSMASFGGTLAFLVSLVAVDADARPRRGSRRPTSTPHLLNTAPPAPQPIVGVIAHGASYLSPSSTQGPAACTSPQLLSDGVTVGAWYVDQGGAVQVAQENPAANITPQICAIQRMAALLDRESMLIEDAFPGTRVSGYSMAQILVDMDTAAAWAAGLGREICFLVEMENSGCFNENNGGDLFSVCQSDLLTHEATIESHLLSRVGTPGYAVGCTDVTLLVNGGHAQGFAATTTPVRHDYADDFPQWAASDPDVSFCGQLHWLEIGADNLHPDTAGGLAMGEAYGRCLARLVGRGDSRAAVLEGVEVVGPASIRATFYAPCRRYGGCLDNPPFSLETTAEVPQTSAGVVTYGFNFWRQGVLQTPGAVTAVTQEPCPVPTTSCTVRLDFATLPNFDEVSFGDTAIGLGHDVASQGGTNLVARLTGPECVGNIDPPCVDWTSQNVFPGVTSLDAGPDAGFADAAADAGPDAAPDSGPADSGVVDSGPADSGVPPDTGVVETQAQFASFNGAGGPTLQIASPPATWTGAEAIAIMAWVQHDTIEQEAWLAQFNAGVTDLFVWAGQEGTQDIALGVGFGIGGYGTTLMGTSRHHIALIFEADNGVGTQEQIRIYVDGVAETVSINGTLPATLTLAGTPGAVTLPEGVWGGDLDEVWIGLWTGASAQAVPIGETEIREHYCTTRASVDSDLAVGGGCVAGGYEQTRGYLAGLAGCEAFFPFEGDAQSVCGSLSFAETGGSVVLVNYP